MSRVQNKNSLFRILKKDKHTQARLGLIRTSHGDFKTPAFVTVATNAAVKGGITANDLQNINGQILLGNTYHLYVRGQVSAVKKAGGLSRFMGWHGLTMTDSGGYQVFSLGDRIQDGVGKFANYDSLPPLLSGGTVGVGVAVHSESLSSSPFIKGREKRRLMDVDNNGVTFRSHIDGKKMRLTPEKSIKIQQDLGADIIFAFDQPTSPIVGLEYSRQALERTHKWAIRCLKRHSRNKQQALFGIVQGGPYENLRKESAKFLAKLDFPGFGIGGSYHRINKSDRFKELDWVIPYLPDNKPRHFLGIGGIEDMIIAVFQGCDTFDCVIPTREARHGRLYLWNPRASFEAHINNIRESIIGNDMKPLHTKFYNTINITNRKFRFNTKQINPNIPDSPTFSYLHHLFRTQELLGQHLATLNNLAFYFSLMERLQAYLKKAGSS